MQEEIIIFSGKIKTFYGFLNYDDSLVTICDGGDKAFVCGMV